MWGILAPYRTPYAETFMCAPSTGKIKQPAKFQHRIFMHHAVMRMCISHRLSIICPKMFLGGFEREDVKILCSDPQKALPCVKTRPSVDVSRVKIGSTA